MDLRCSLGFVLDFGDGGGALAIFLVGWTPTGLLVWFVAHRAAKRNAVHQAMLVAAEVSPGAGFDHAESGTGLALNPQARIFTLWTGGQWKTYSYADIREWDAIKETPGVVVGGHLAAVGPTSIPAGCRPTTAADRAGPALGATGEAVRMGCGLLRWALKPPVQERAAAVERLCGPSP